MLRCRTSSQRHRIDFIDTLPGEFPQQPFEPAEHFANIGIMAQSGLQRSTGDPGLAFINFPGMKVKDTGLAIPLHHRAHVVQRQRIRQQTEKSTATTRPIAPEFLDRGDRYLDEIAALQRIERKSRRVGDAVKVMPNGIYA